MSLTLKTTHAAEAVARLAQQFKGKPYLEGTVGAFAQQTQDLEAAHLQLYTLRWLATASGVQLDGIGSIIGEPRLGKDDTTYRLYLAARLLLNGSSGLPEEILELASLILGAGIAFRLLLYYPAAWVLEVLGACPVAAASFASILSEARAGGVRGFLHYSDSADGETFTFASGDAPEASANQGFEIELVVNGDFDAWTADNPDSWAVGESVPNREVSEVGVAEGHGGAGVGACNLYATAGAGSVYVLQAITTVPGRTYVLRVSVTNYVQGTLRVRDTSWLAFSQDITAAGDYEITFTAASSSFNLFLGRPDTAAFDVTVDDVSILTGGVWADALEA